VHYAEKVEGHKIRARSESFRDYFSQATLFWKSLSPIEQEHLIAAAHFELGKVEAKEVRERMVALFDHVDHNLAARVAEGVGVAVPKENPRPGSLPPAGRRQVERSPALSMQNTVKDTIKSRRIAILAGDGVDEATVQSVKMALKEKGAQAEVVAKALGTLKGANGQQVPVDKSSITTASIMYDAVFIPGGQESVAQLIKQGDARHFVAEAFKHGKAIGAVGAGVELLRHADLAGFSIEGARSDGGVTNSQGVVTVQNPSDLRSFIQQFIEAIAQHRHWMRPQEQVPA
jgi:catalase